MATSGKIGGWDIESFGLSNTTSSGDAYIYLERTYSDGNIDSVSLGLNELVSYSRIIGVSNTEGKGVQNVAIELEARNGTAVSGDPVDFANIAMRSHGTIQHNGEIYLEKSDGTYVKGYTGEADGGVSHFVIQNGLIVAIT